MTISAHNPYLTSQPTVTSHFLDLSNKSIPGESAEDTAYAYGVARNLIHACAVPAYGMLFPILLLKRKKWCLREVERFVGITHTWQAVECPSDLPPHPQPVPSATESFPKLHIKTEP